MIDEISHTELPQDVELVAELEARVERRTREILDLYEGAPCGYLTVDERGVLVRINETLLRWLGRRRDDLVGRSPFESLVAEEHREAIRSAVLGLPPAPAAREVEVALLRADGERLWVLLSAARDPSRPGKVRVTSFDLTARREAERTLREREEAVRRSRDELSAANAALERAALAKDEFLASMSHELRTPLNAILGLAEALQEEVYGPVPDPQLRALRRIEESGRHLLALINDILDLSKVEAGQLVLDRQPTSVDDVCRSSLRLVQEAAIKKRIRVDYELGDPRAALLADERRLKQILVNLLSNAVKFTPEGGLVRLEASVSAAEETASFTVIDTGVGIAEEDLSRLFRPFVQLDSTLARQHAGTGLGLALVRKLVELHGGGIRVASTPGVGSTFAIVLPWSPLDRTRRSTAPPSSDAEPQSVPRPGAPPPSARVVLAEDDATTIAMLTDFLVAHGVTVRVARNGEEALALVDEDRPDLVLMDVQMPVLDGLSAIQRLRQSPVAEVREVPVIALTALAMSGDLERCRAAGADGYLTKPLRLRKLLATIAEHVPSFHFVPPSRASRTSLP